MSIASLDGSELEIAPAGRITQEIREDASRQLYASIDSLVKVTLELKSDCEALEKRIVELEAMHVQIEIDARETTIKDCAEIADAYALKPYETNAYEIAMAIRELLARATP